MEKAKAVASEAPNDNDEVAKGEFKAEIVWRNAIGMALLHLSALYGLTRMSEMRAYTIAWAYVLFYCNTLVSMHE